MQFVVLWVCSVLMVVCIRVLLMLWFCCVGSIEIGLSLYQLVLLLFSLIGDSVMWFSSVVFFLVISEIDSVLDWCSVLMMNDLVWLLWGVFWKVLWVRVWMVLMLLGCFVWICMFGFFVVIWVLQVVLWYVLVCFCVGIIMGVVFYCYDVLGIYVIEFV